MKLDASWFIVIALTLPSCIFFPDEPLEHADENALTPSNDAGVPDSAPPDGRDAYTTDIDGRDVSADAGGLDDVGADVSPADAADVGPDADTEPDSTDTTEPPSLPGHLEDPSMLSVWLRAADGIEQDPDSRVRRWSDTRAGLDAPPSFEQAEAGRRPAFASSPAAVAFDGGQVLRDTAHAYDQLSAFVVIKRTSPANNGLILGNCDQDSNGYGNNQFGFEVDNLGQLRLQFFGRYVAVGPTTYSMSGHADESNAWQLVQLVKSPVDGVRILQDGVVKVSRDDPAPNTWAFNQIGAWCDRNGRPSSAFQGKIAEILVFDSVLDSEDVEAVETYLGGKYLLE